MNEVKVKGSKEFIDERGKISNYELTEPINWIGYIESKRNTLRANHYHPVQEQKVLLIAGRYISVSKKLPDGDLETIVVNPGDLIITPPNIAHTMIFLEDSIFLNLVNGDREKENYGVHTIPYKLVDDDFKDELFKNHQTECYNCGNRDIFPVISFGMSPLANNLLDNIDIEDSLYPLQVNYCSKCYLCQLSHFVSKEKLFNNYLYLSSISSSFKEHFENLAFDLVKNYNPKIVLDIGSNDGIFLKPIKEKGVMVIGIEPAKNVAEIATQNGINTINAYFEDLDINLLPKNIDIVTAFNVFAHTKFTKEITNKVFQILKPGGIFIIEVQYLVDMISKLIFDNIYHEHLFYYSVTSLNNLFSNLGGQIVKVEHIDTHGGSIRVYIQRKEDVKLVDKSVEEFLNKEKGIVDNYESYLNFAKKIRDLKNKILNKLNSLEGLTIGYGSPAKATTLLNYFGIKLPYTIEDNPIKQNKYIPGVKTKIISKDDLKKIGIPKNIIVFAWNFFDEIKQKNKDLIEKGVNFVNLLDLK